MGAYLQIDKILETKKTFFSTRDVAVVLGIKNTRTLENTISGLINSGLFAQLERGKYYLKRNAPSDFAISSYLYNPSYISLESALNYYGILSQFPFEITSVTAKKTCVKKIDDKIYSYSQLKKELLTGYESKNGFLIACPEKALFDYFYFIFKSLRTENYLNEMELSQLSKNKVASYLPLVSVSSESRIAMLIKKYL
ncbi:hypothetical protein COT69_01835 [candidate division WWE3 bacterium CG09_land_8_20_14_0_10_39_24]|uniref:Transcriptional regulator n=1 Tax=candidate division WWE3 bacterium CG09_land_8_20_14_0_10_39_24 TaxID=1975088 RepID=A0A2H0WJN2_UNCKA|nr:MAG: hypothetical protein BK003_01810 [bacterium CG09_39_24]PIS12861.1 MAG: hypothetical protein COT69_01835 [candidate division WWE3 bacterium CG09_land_8_20_14_0_10_39_24]PJE51624.1 MAG: hypothetical protein COV27_01875 [candidate division WWE3 bacterium CG10_big_fil_rev_8_21_14_0_10_39_14]